MSGAGTEVSINKENVPTEGENDSAHESITGKLVVHNNKIYS